MKGLTHEQARRFLHAAADKCLNPGHQAALAAHIADCAACRNYAEELNALHVAIARALRSRWSPPRRPGPSPGDMATRVRHRMWFDAERRLFLACADALVKLGSLAVMAIMVIGLVQGSFLQANRTSPLTDSHAANNLINGLPSFELEENSDTSAGIASYSGDSKQWLLPAIPFSRLRISPY